MAMYAAMQVPLLLLGLQHWHRKQTNVNVPFIVMCVSSGMLLAAMIIRQARGEIGVLEKPTAASANAVEARKAEIEAVFSAAAEVSETEEPPTCAICLLECDQGETSVVLPCSHGFHRQCISRWWLRQPETPMKCPLCRQQPLPTMTMGP